MIIKQNIFSWQCEFYQIKHIKVISFKSNNAYCKHKVEENRIENQLQFKMTGYFFKRNLHHTNN